MLVLGKIWRVTRRYWYVGVGLIVSILSLIFLRRRHFSESHFDAIADAWNAASEEAWVERVQAASGKEVALDAVRQRYAEEAKWLTEKERARVEELQDNPAEMAHRILRAGRRGRP